MLYNKNKKRLLIIEWEFQRKINIDKAQEQYVYLVLIENFLLLFQLIPQEVIHSLADMVIGYH